MNEICSKLYVGLHVKYQLFLSDFNERGIFLADLRRIIKYLVLSEPTCWEQSVTCGQIDGQTDMTKLIIGFRNFANALKKEAVRQTVIIVKTCHLCQLHIKFFPIFSCQSWLHVRKKLMHIISVGCTVRDQQLILYSAFVKRL
jgi:hypothetical protein